jgi:hypothetical protein
VKNKSIGNIANKMKLGLANPSLLLRKLSQVHNRIRYTTGFNPSGIDFMSQDWDNLLILDACRYDLFKQVNNIPGNLSYVESRGSATPEFLRGNFHGEEFLDTIYITTNPMLWRHRDDIQVDFYKVINLWTGDTWDEINGTVLPEIVTSEAKRIADMFPNKRLLIHYMQPHYPFIDSKTTFDKGHIGDDAPDELTTWMKIMTGEVEIDKDTLWNAYADNLRRALPHVEDLTEYLSGKTVITSDHGNMFGERSSPIPIREWRHPQGIWTEELIKVPWLEVAYAERKDIISEPPIELSEIGDTPVQQRLESLGYKS